MSAHKLRSSFGCWMGFPRTAGGYDPLDTVRRDRVGPDDPVGLDNDGRVPAAGRSVCAGGGGAPSRASSLGALEPRSAVAASVAPCTVWRAGSHLTICHCRTSARFRSNPSLVYVAVFTRVQAVVFVPTNEARAPATLALTTISTEDCGNGALTASQSTSSKIADSVLRFRLRLQANHRRNALPSCRGEYYGDPPIELAIVWCPRINLRLIIAPMHSRHRPVRYAVVGHMHLLEHLEDPTCVSALGGAAGRQSTRPIACAYARTTSVSASRAIQYLTV
jgi:hypothetical protein